MLRGESRVWHIYLCNMLLYHTAVDWVSSYREVVFDIMISQHEKTPKPTRGGFTQQVEGYFRFSCPSASSSSSTSGSTIQIFTQKMT